MSVAIVICSRDRARLLVGALEAVNAVRRRDDELVVVDSASRDEAVRGVAERAGALVVRCRQPGVSRARNAGVAATAAPILAFTDDDCRPAPGWLDQLERAFEDRSVGFATGRVWPDRETGRALSVVVGDAGRTLRDGDDPAAAGAGANAAARRDAFQAVSGFDEAMGPGSRFPAAEDHDLFWRLLRAGWHGRYHPPAEVVHVQWRTACQFLGASYGYGVGTGALAAKAARVGGPQGRAMVADAVWDRGLVQAARHLRNRYEAGAAASAVTTTGVVRGLAGAWRVPLAGDRFRDGG